MARPFEGIRVINVTHVLAGPFATYQLAVLGANVIKVEHPDEPDQSRSGGTDKALNRAQLGTSFLAQGSNKRPITLDLKTGRDRDILKKLVATADVFVENYRPGALEALGLGYEALAAINPRLIYASFSAFGDSGPRRERTAYDHVIQATSGIMAMTGTPDVQPGDVRGAGDRLRHRDHRRFRAFRRAVPARTQWPRPAHRHGDAQRRDDPDEFHLAGYLRNGTHPKPHGNRHVHATNGAYETKDGLLMLGASNLRQQRRLWTVLERPDLIKRSNDERERDHARETAVLDRIMLNARTADEWEEFFQARHVPAARVRTMGEAVADPQTASRGVIHRHASAPGIEGGFGVPVAAFTFAHDGPRVDTPPPAVGQHNEEIFAELGLAQRKVS